MAFLRVKRSGGRAYAYLVENAWVPGRAQPRQRVLRYLGRLDRLTPGQVPVRFRTPTLLHRLHALRTNDRAHRGAAVAAIARPFLNAILEGDEPRAAQLVARARRLMGIEAVPERLLRPALAEIGARWEAGRLPVSQEHVATGIVAHVLGRENDRLAVADPAAPLVVLCVPESEQHTLPLLFAEGMLRRRGFRTLNTNGGAPATETARYLDSLAPAAVLISVTQPERLGRARTLAATLRARRPRLKVVIGGQGVGAERARTGDAAAELFCGPLEEYLREWRPTAVGPARRTGVEPAEGGPT